MPQSKRKRIPRHQAQQQTITQSHSHHPHHSPPRLLNMSTIPPQLLTLLASHLTIPEVEVIKYDPTTPYSTSTLEALAAGLPSEDAEHILLYVVQHRQATSKDVTTDIALLATQAELALTQYNLQKHIAASQNYASLLTLAEIHNNAGQCLSAQELLLDPRSGNMLAATPLVYIRERELARSAHGLWKLDDAKELLGGAISGMRRLEKEGFWEEGVGVLQGMECLARSWGMVCWVRIG